MLNRGDVESSADSVFCVRFASAGTDRKARAQRLHQPRRPSPIAHHQDKVTCRALLHPDSALLAHKLHLQANPMHVSDTPTYLTNYVCASPQPDLTPSLGSSCVVRLGACFIPSHVPCGQSSTTFGLTDFQPGLVALFRPLASREPWISYNVD